MLSRDQGDRAAGEVEGAGEELEERLVRGSLHRGCAHPDLERTVANCPQAGTRGARLRPDRELDSAGDCPDGVPYGVPAFFGARNDTLSSTRTGASASGAATASSSLRWPETSARSSDSNRAR